MDNILSYFSKTRNAKFLVVFGIIATITIVSMVGFSYAKEFTMFGNTFDGNSECAEWAIKYYEARAKNPYNLEQVQPVMIISKHLCDPNSP